MPLVCSPTQQLVSVLHFHRPAVHSQAYVFWFGLSDCHPLWSPTLIDNIDSCHRKKPRVVPSLLFFLVNYTLVLHCGVCISNRRLALLGCSVSFVVVSPASATIS